MNTHISLILAFILLSLLLPNVSSQGWYNHGGNRRGYYREPPPKKKGPPKDELYGLLKIDRRSDARQIKRAFKKLALENHPDKVPEEKKEAAQQKFGKISEAYNILSDPEQRSVYDRGGWDAQDRWNEEKQSMDQHEAQQNIYKEREERMMDAQNLFEKSADVLVIDVGNMTRFYRRIDAWIILFYKGLEMSKFDIQNVYESLATRYSGIFTVAAINCTEEEEICQEFIVTETPLLQGYRADKSEGIPYEGANKTVGALAMFIVGLMDDFVSIVHDQNYSDFTKKNLQKVKILLFTEKTTTPPLFKAQSKEFRQSVDFGQVKSKNSPELIEKFNIKHFPSIIYLTSAVTYQGELYEDKIAKDEIVKFIRKKVVANEDGETIIGKSDKVIIIDSENYKNGPCSAQDSIVCIILISDQAKNHLDTMDLVRQSFIKDKYNFYLVEKSMLDFKELTGNELQEKENDSFIDLLIIKGNRGKYSVYSGPGDVDSIVNYIDLAMSQPFRRMKNSFKSSIEVTNPSQDL